MHEMALVRDVVDVVVEAAEKSGAQAVKNVTLVIGRGRDIVIDLFTDIFTYLSKGTVAEGAELSIERTPMLARCEDCGMIYPIDVFKKRTWPCPRCGSEKRVPHSGFEFRIERIEIAHNEQETPSFGCIGCRA